MVRCSLVCVIAPVIVFSQTPVSPTFEVATIKPATRPSPESMMSGKVKLGETIEPGRVVYSFVNAEYMLTKAYGVKAWQVSGPPWIQSERFDIVAKRPSGSTKEQVPEMLKSLLTDRFKIVLHQEVREHAVYELQIAKGGPKLKESVSVKPGTDAGGMNTNTPARSKMRASLGPDGMLHWEGSQMSIDSFIEYLTRFVDTPIVDQTNLKGEYDLKMVLSMAEVQAIAQSAGLADPGVTPRGGAGGSPAAAASDPSGSTIFQNVRNMGLQLKSGKAQFGFIVVDSGNKTPTEN